MKYFGIGTLVGILLGVAAGILYAPDNGVEMRDKLKDAAHKASEKVVEVRYDLHKIFIDSDECIKQSI